MASRPGHLYFCYQCERTVRLSSLEILICPECNSDFIEERPGGPAPEDAPSPSDFTFNELDYMGPGLGQLLEHVLSHHMQVTPMTSSRALNHNNDGPSQILRLGMDARDLHPILLLQGRIQNLLNLRNGDLFNDNGGPLRLPGTIGDYFVGHDVEHLIQQLDENDRNKYGTPPASKSAIEALPTISISEEHLGTDASHCAVCKDEFELCSQVKQMPCNHMYHPDCILPWLALHNSCPVCRLELPTDDLDYERARAQGLRAGESSGTAVAEGAQEGDRGQNSFTFQSLAGQPIVASYTRETGNASEQQDALYSAETSGSTQGGNNSGSDGGSGTGRRFSLVIPWFRGTPATSQPLANTRAGNLSDDGDTVMPETRQED